MGSREGPSEAGAAQSSADRFAGFHPGRRLGFQYPLLLPRGQPAGAGSGIEVPHQHDGGEELEAGQIEARNGLTRSPSLESEEMGKCFVQGRGEAGAATDLPCPSRSAVLPTGDTPAVVKAALPCWSAEAQDPDPVMILKAFVLDAPATWQCQLAFGAMLVPAGMEDDWMYTEESGQWQLLNSASARRLLIVSRLSGEGALSGAERPTTAEQEQDYDPQRESGTGEEAATGCPQASLEDVTDGELKQRLERLVVSVAPMVSFEAATGRSIPFLTFEDNVLLRDVLEVAHSPLTGSILVEDVILDLDFNACQAGVASASCQSGDAESSADVAESSCQVGWSHGQLGHQGGGPMVSLESPHGGKPCERNCHVAAGLGPGSPAGSAEQCQSQWQKGQRMLLKRWAAAPLHSEHGSLAAPSAGPTRTALRRRLRFQRMPNLIQSEVPLRLLHGSGQGGPIPPLLSQEFQKLPRCCRVADYSHLVHKYLPPIVAGFPLISALLSCSEPGHILVLGGGAFTLPIFLRSHLPHHVHVVELDPVIVQLARTHFGLVADGHMHVHIGDALQYMRQLASTVARRESANVASSDALKGGSASDVTDAELSTVASGGMGKGDHQSSSRKSRFRKGKKRRKRPEVSLEDASSMGGLRPLAIILDIDDTSATGELSSPPAAFLTDEFLSLVKRSLDPRGMLAMNVVPCSEAGIQSLLAKLKRSFSEVYSAHVEDDVNLVVYCLPQPARMQGVELVSTAIQKLVPLELMQKVELVE